MKVRIFNGFVPDAFPAKHQSQQQMVVWHAKLKEAAPDMLTFNKAFDECWAASLVVSLAPLGIQSADYPNSPTDRYASPEDALRSQIVLCQRFQWLVEAALTDKSTDMWAWVEPTIFKQRGITAEVVQQFLRDVAAGPTDVVSLPGIWPKQPIQDHINHWRFAGSAWVCPASLAFRVAYAMMDLIRFRTRHSRRLCWDNSSWSYMELLNVLPMRWYPGNHDETQLTNYLNGVSTCAT